MAAPSSGTNTEAGLDRRYANSSLPGSWYSAEYDVTPGQPFLLRNIETFDGAKTKKYNIYVDDTLVKTYLFKQPSAGRPPRCTRPSSTTRLRSRPQRRQRADQVRVPARRRGLLRPVDRRQLGAAGVRRHRRAARLGVRHQRSGAVGDNGWYRGDATVAVKAADNRDGAPVIETGESAGWQAYVAPVPVAGDGKHVLSYRAKDAAGNSTR